MFTTCCIFSAFPSKFTLSSEIIPCMDVVGLIERVMQETDVSGLLVKPHAEESPTTDGICQVMGVSPNDRIVVADFVFKGEL